MLQPKIPIVKNKKIKVVKIRIIYTNVHILGSSVINEGDTLQLKGLGYEDMAGTYKCTVTSIGGQNSAASTLKVYCKYHMNAFHVKSNYNHKKSSKRMVWINNKT